MWPPSTTLAAVSTAEPTMPYAPSRRRSRAVSYAVPLGAVSGVLLVALAILSVSNGELVLRKPQVVAVVAVNALVKLVFAGSLVVLSRFSRRRLPGAFWGNALISALCVPYLALELFFKIPGVALQVTLPGNNVLNTANLRLELNNLRPPWHESLEVTLAILCLAALVTLMSALISAVIAQLRSLGEADGSS